MRAYLGAIRARDATRFCSALTRSRREFIAESQSADDCLTGQRRAWRAAEGQLGSAGAKRLYATYARSEIFDVEVTGRSATAALDVPPAAGPLANADSVSLSVEGGRWRIDEVGGG